uniref:PCNA-interacting partner n=2 Tax=Ornithorhynchus anatinus TaxID=9258 RepID=A0A6I8N4K2_ORNAN
MKGGGGGGPVRQQFPLSRCPPKYAPNLGRGGGGGRCGAVGPPAGGRAGSGMAAGGVGGVGGRFYFRGKGRSRRLAARDLNLNLAGAGERLRRRRPGGLVPPVPTGSHWFRPGSDLVRRMTTLQESVSVMIRKFRRGWRGLCNSERTTVCGADFMLLALQLSVAEINKQRSGEFTASLSDVLATWKFLLHEKLDLPYEDVKVLEHYGKIKKTYDDFLENSNMLDLIDVYQKCSLLASECENEEMSPIQLLDFISGLSCGSEANTNAYVMSSPSTTHNQDHIKVQLAVKKLIFAYLSLLVNSRNDLALAQILNFPDRGLGREAFTDLKHAAQQKHMSIFLVATSFIRTIELGGKGYAPVQSDPLRTHVKGLLNFVHFIDKLEEILGEIPNPRIAGNRILSIIKMQLIKGRSPGDPFCLAVEEAVQDLDLKIENIVNSQQEDMLSTCGISPARPKPHAINHGTAYCGRDTVKVLLVLLDKEAASPPTKNKAELLHGAENVTSCSDISILTLFTSPVQSSGSSLKPLRERVQKTIEKEKKAKLKQTLIKSQFACTYKEDLMTKKNDKFGSMNQLPTSIYQGSEQEFSLGLENVPLSGVNSTVEKASLGMSCGNVDLNRRKREKVTIKSSCQSLHKNSKGEQVDLNSENTCCDNDNKPPQCNVVKRSKTSSNPLDKLYGKPAEAAKGKKPTARKKLITGQAKITSFFRL